MKTQIKSTPRHEAGYSALFITLILVGATVLMLGATLSRSNSGIRLNDRNNAYLSANGAAEAAVEKALAYVIVDFQNSGEGQVLSNINFYETSLLPTSTENPYWTNYTWSDGQGNNNRIYVARVSTGTNAPYVALEEQYQGLSGYASTYRILANVTVTNTTYGYTFTNAVQQDVQLAQIPVFQFAIFYNNLMEFSDSATLTVNGPVHANTNIYVGSQSGSSLTFNSVVTTVGNITSPPNMGFTTNSWQGPITYNAGFKTSAPTLTLPIGTNSMSGTNVQQILYPPPSDGSEVASSPMGQQRYYNKADMVLLISNNTFTATFKSAANDANAYTISTNLNMLTNAYWLTNTLDNTVSNRWTTNWGQYWSWLSTTNTFFDWRENKTVNVAQIDVGLLNTWITNWFVSWNTNVAGKFTAQNPFNIIYIADWRTNGSTLYAVRLVNGTNLPSSGLTVATPNPMYIKGVYNCPMTGGYLGTTNTTHSAPASIAADAITILSPSWTDGSSAATHGTTASGSWTEANETATSNTVNTAMIAGIVPSTGTGSGTGQNSGGAMNFPRLLELWSGQKLTLNTSIVCLFSSTWATGGFIMPGLPNSYYSAPTRQFSFDQNYTISSKMPPGTPNICRLIRATWCNPPPGTVTYAPSPTLDFVAR